MRFLTLALVLLGGAAVSLPAQADNGRWGARNTDFPPAFAGQFRAPRVDTGVEPRVVPVASRLVHPWGIAVLPGGDGYLVTERPGRLRHVARDGTVSPPITGLPEVVDARQGGLLDITLAPDFARTREIYWTYAKPVGDGLSATAAGTGRLSADMSRVLNARDIFVQTPGSTAPMHFGSRIVFDRNGRHVFVTTGEHSTARYRVLAQDLRTTYGQVIRLRRDGTVPANNPFVGQAGARPETWSYGHRNIQGATLIEGDLWTIEHGPKGGDELNRPGAGRNYGWPVVSYGENYNGRAVGSGKSSGTGFEEPVYFWDPVIAPAGMTVYGGSTFPEWRGDLLISSLRPGGLVRLRLRQGRVIAEERLLTELGRVRDVAVDHDGSVLVLTDFKRGQLLRISR